MVHMQTPLPQLIEDLYQVIAEPSQWRRMLDTLAAQLNIDLLIVSVHPAAPVASRCLPGGGRDTKRLTETQITSVADALLSVSRGVREPTQPGEYLVSVPVAALLRKYNQTHSLTTLARADFSYVEHAWLGKHADMQLCLTMLSRVPAEHQELGDEAEQLANRTQRSVAVRTLAPHLARCLRVGIDNGTLNAVRMYGMLAIKNATFGVFHIRASGELGLINPYGHDLASGNGLTIIDRQLHATDEEIDEELQSLISATLNGQLRSATSLRVNRREGEFPLVLTISALPELDRLAMDPPAAILLVTDPTLTVPPDTLPLQRIFGMTRAEAGVARSIMAGKSIEECAEENGHSVATSRNLLKRAFQKTGTHRQSELSALLQCAFLKLDIQRLHRS